MERIIVAGGCFWGVQAYYDKLNGILQTKVGYTDSEGEYPTYQDVCKASGHVEAVEIYYDEEVISYEKILEHLFRMIDPTTLNRQGGDIGIQYRSGIYYHTKWQKEKALEFIKKEQVKYEEPIVVEVKPESCFYDAEEYHQVYLEKNPAGYCHINLGLIKESELKQV